MQPYPKAEQRFFSVQRKRNTTYSSRSSHATGLGGRQDWALWTFCFALNEENTVLRDHVVMVIVHVLLRARVSVCLAG